MYKYDKSNKLKHNLLSCFLFCLIALQLILLLQSEAYSLNMGRMKTNSSYGKPFEADINLLDVPENITIAQIKVNLADKTEYSKIGLKYDSKIDDFTFKPYKNEYGDWFIKVKSTRPVNNTFVDFLVALEWPQGRIMREYMTIIKSPVDNTANTSQVAKKVSDFNPVQVKYQDNKIKKQKKLEKIEKTIEQKSDNTKNTPEVKNKALVSELKVNNIDKNNHKKIKRLVNTNTVKTLDNKDNKSLSNQNQSQNKSINNIIKTQKGDNLWVIASRYATNDANRIQLMIAIYNKNKSAFIANNADLLKQNMELYIPSEKEASSYPSKLASLYNNKSELKPNLAKSYDSSNIAKNTSKSTSKTRGSKTALTNNNIIKINNNLFTEPQNSKSDKNISLDKFNTVKEDIKQNQINQANKYNKSRLEIVTKDINNNKNNKAKDDYLLASEILVSKQKENTDLKEEILILKAQLKDLEQLARLNNELDIQQNINQNINKQKVLAKEAKEAKETKETKKLNKKPESLGSLGALETTSSLSSLNNIAPVASLNKQIAKSNNNNNSLFSTLFWVWFGLLCGLVGLVLIYFYWARNVKMQTQTPIFDEEDNLSSADINNTNSTNYKVAEPSFIDNQKDINKEQYTTHASAQNQIQDHEMMNDEEVNSSLDLVKAYIELNDHDNAQKILDVIMQNGTKEQKKRAEELLDQLVCA